jgi:hypothetical protein
LVLKVKEALTALYNGAHLKVVTIVSEVEGFSFGKFGWIVDTEGNKVELWEPIDKAFL